MTYYFIICSANKHLLSAVFGMGFRTNSMVYKASRKKVVVTKISVLGDRYIYVTMCVCLCMCMKFFFLFLRMLFKQMEIKLSHKRLILKAFSKFCSCITRDPTRYLSSFTLP